MAESRGHNANATEPFGRTAAHKYQAQILPESQRDYLAQSQRRAEALMDVCNHVSLAATWPAVLKECLSEESVLQAGENIFNVDTTHVLLQNSPAAEGRLLMAAGSKKELHKRQLNPASTTTREVNLKRRGIGLTPVISAAGGLVTCVVTIKDGSFTTVQTHKLPEFPNCTYRVYLICVPCPQRAKSRSKKKKPASIKSQTESTPAAAQQPAVESPSAALPVIAPAETSYFHAGNHENDPDLLPFGEIDLDGLEERVMLESLLHEDNPLGDLLSDDEDALEVFDDLYHDFDMMKPQNVSAPPSRAEGLPPAPPPSAAAAAPASAAAAAVKQLYN